MGKIFKLTILSILFFNTCIAQTNNPDKVNGKNIHTVQFYRNDLSPQTIINPPVTNLNQRHSIVLEFDELGDQAKYFYAKVVHCNADWSESSLSSAEFMSEYNEFLIEDYNFSFNTKVEFTHYRFVVPRVKVSGNYLLKVYHSDKPDDIIISKRFMIYESLVNIVPHFRVSELVGKRESHQQIGFEVYYDQFEIVMPQKEIKATIRQNQRWDNARTDLSPLYFDIGREQLDFRYFDESTNFIAWNEFRNFAFRSAQFDDINVKELDINNQEVLLSPLRSRAEKSYVNYIELNGNYIIENNRGDAQLSSDYFNTHFEFYSEKKIGDFYVAGRLSNWEFNDKNKFIYNSEYKKYECDIILKQGYYDFLVHYKSNSTDEEPYIMEGSFFSTQNDYEIIIYHTAIGSRFDRIVGYLYRPFFER
ncbi:MAG: DUF5103 domain-containing protein [Cytophagales bacterium]